MLYRSHICETFFIIFNDFNFHKHHGILYEEFDSFQTLDIINSKTHACFPLYGKNHIKFLRSNSPSGFGTCMLPVPKYTCNTCT